MGSPLGAWSALQHRAQYADQSKPVSDLVQSLIGIQDRREEKERLKRQEERLARLDAEQSEQLRKAEEWRTYEAQKELDARTRSMEKVPVELIKQIGNIDLSQPEAPAAPEVQESTVDHEKIVKKKADGSSETIERPTKGARKTGPEGTFEWTGERWDKIADPSLDQLDTQDLGGGPATPGVPETLPMMQKTIEERLQRREGLPETRTGPMGEYAPEYLEDVLRRKEAETAVGPAAMQARLQALLRETPKERMERELKVAERKEQLRAKYRTGEGRKQRWQIVGTPEKGLFRVNPDDGKLETIMEPTGEVLDRPPPKVIEEMRDISFLAKKTMNLAELPSAYQEEAAKWTPNIIRNYMSPMHKEEEDSFFSKYQKYDPAYFLFAAEMLKATQGGRPSDKDLEFYLEKMPKIEDQAETKAEKIHWLLSQLRDKADSNYESYGHWYDMEKFNRVVVPSYEEILALSGKHSSGGKSEVPAGGGVSKEQLDALRAEVMGNQ